jgi:hypothetical protein
MSDLATRQAHAAFADLACADPGWLRAEFDALIRAAYGPPPNWPRPPAPPRLPRPGRQASRPGPPGPPARPAAVIRTAPRDRFRQRSPPADG